jgi:hypothetical protein
VAFPWVTNDRLERTPMSQEEPGPEKRAPVPAGKPEEAAAAATVIPPTGE